MNQPNLSEELQHIRKRARRRLVGAVALVVFALIVLWTVLDNTPPPQFSSNHPVEIISSAPALAASNASVVAVEQTASGSEYQHPPVDAGSAVEEQNPAANPPAHASAVQASVADILPGKLVNHQMPVKPRASSASSAAKPTVVKPAKPASAVSAKPVDVAKPAEPDPRRILEGFDDGKPSAEAKPVPASKPAGGKFFVQIGAFSDADKAAGLLAKLKDAGLPAFAEKVKTSKGELTRIRIGPTTDEAHANEWRKKSEAAGVPGKVTK